MDNPTAPIPLSPLRQAAAVERFKRNLLLLHLLKNSCCAQKPVKSEPCAAMAAEPSGQQGESGMMPVFRKRAKAANASCLSVCTVSCAGWGCLLLLSPYLHLSSEQSRQLSRGSFATKIMCPETPQPGTCHPLRAAWRSGTAAATFSQGSESLTQLCGHQPLLLRGRSRLCHPPS